jgi:hypothetical protein
MKILNLKYVIIFQNQKSLKVIFFLKGIFLNLNKCFFNIIFIIFQIIMYLFFNLLIILN